MGKVLAFVLVLVFALSACASCATGPGPETAPDAPAPAPAPATTPEPETLPDEPDHGLINFMDWLKLHPEEIPSFDIEADFLIFSKLRDDGYRTTGLLYPRQWPGKQFGDSIPEYTGTGYMQELYITHPNMSIRADDIESMKISIYEYKDEDMDEYIAGLSGFAPDEELADEYFREGAEAQPYVRSVRSFRKDGVILNIIFAEEDETVLQFLNSGKFVQIEAIYSREAYSFDPDTDEPTDLLNFFDFAKEVGFEVPAEMSLDYLMDTYDGSGMHYSMISTPSKWPREAFGDLLPMYTGFGFMQKLEIATPQDDTSEENALLLSMYITTDSSVDIDAYARRIADFGYYELPPDEFSEHEKAMLDERELVRVFCLPGLMCVVSTLEEANVPTLEITLVFEGRRQGFFASQAPAEGQEGDAML